MTSTAIHSIKTTTLVLLLNFTVIFPLSSCKSISDSSLNPGSIAPEIALTDLNGQTIMLSDFKGKTVLINFWATWCAPCVKELPDLERLYNRLKSRGFVILAVGGDDELDKLRAFQREYGLSFPIVFDIDGKAQNRYQINGFPESFIVGPDGKLVMITDTLTGRDTVKIIGPREWAAPDMVSQIEAIMAP